MTAVQAAETTGTGAEKRRIILASQSPRRIEILRRHGLDPEVRPADIDETLPPGIGPRDAVMFLSWKKARTIEKAWLEEHGLPDLAAMSYQDAAALEEEQKENESDGASAEAAAPEDAGDQNDLHPIILAADTVVYKEEIMGKPKDREDALRMLQEIRNGVHFVATGVTMMEAGTTRRRTFCEVTKVFCRDYTDEEILDYIDREQPYDKAGAYAIQGSFREHIDHIEGYYDNVVGLPWEPVARMLDQWETL